MRVEKMGKEKAHGDSSNEQTFPLKAWYLQKQLHNDRHVQVTHILNHRLLSALWIRRVSPFPTMLPIPEITAEVKRDTGQMAVTRRPFRLRQNMGGFLDVQPQLFGARQ